MSSLCWPATTDFSLVGSTPSTSIRSFSGKSQLACALSSCLRSGGVLTYVLDEDNIRHNLCRDLGFGIDESVEYLRRVGEVAKLFADAGVICITSIESPYKKDREACRALLPRGRFIEVLKFHSKVPSDSKQSL